MAYDNPNNNASLAFGNAPIKINRKIYNEDTGKFEDYQEVNEGYDVTSDTEEEEEFIWVFDSNTGTYRREYL